MKRLEWSEKYATGIRIIDSQHQYLFTLTNRLIRDLQEEKDISFGDTLNLLIDYAESHFDAEETIMKQARYPGLSDHRRLHTNLRERLALYATELKQGKLSAESLVAFLRTWLEIHILKEDMKYVRAVKKITGT